MTDRQPTPGKEGRVRLTFDDGSVKYARVEMADDPLEVGDPLNKATFWPDDVASLFGLGADSLPRDGFKAIYNNSLFINFDVYSGTGLFGKDNPNVIEVDGVPKFLIVTQYTFSTRDLYLSRLITGSLSDEIIAVSHNAISEVGDEKLVVTTSFYPPRADKKGRVEWYSLESADAQLNTDGAHYMALVLCDGRGRFT